MHKGLRGDHNRPGGGAGRRPGVVWFRNDLRLHDNEALVTANKECSSLLFVYCFDPRDYGKKDWWTKVVPHQARFLLDSVADLRTQLRDLGSELIVRLGRPEQVLPELVRKAGAAGVFCEDGAGASPDVMRNVAAAVEAEGGRLRAIWGSATLFHAEDLPFRLADTPATLSAFKDRVAKLPVRKALSIPPQLRGQPLGADVPFGDIPTLEQLGVDATKLADAQMAQPGMPRGGEREALARLRTHVERLKAGSSEPLSKSLGVAFLAMGCLSPRRIYHELQAFLPPNPIATSRASQGASPGTPSQAAGKQKAEQKGPVLVVYELLWRDFFRFQAKQCALIASRKQPQVKDPARVESAPVSMVPAMVTA